MRTPTRRPALAALLLGAALAVSACAAGRGVTRESMFEQAPPDMDVHAITLEVTGRRSTIWSDEEAEARLRRTAGVLQVGHAAGRNTLMVLTETTTSPDVLVMALEADFTVHVVEVVRREPK